MKQHDFLSLIITLVSLSELSRITAYSFTLPRSLYNSLAFFPTWSTLFPAALLQTTPESLRPSWSIFILLARIALLALTTALGVNITATHRNLSLPCNLVGTVLLTYLHSFDGTTASNLIFLLPLLAASLATTTLSPATTRHVGTRAARHLLAVVYALASLWKVNEDWLTAAQPLQRWLSSRHILPATASHSVSIAALVLCWASLLLEVGAAYAYAAPARLSLRSRRLLVLLLTFFHLTNATLFNLGGLPWLFIASLVLLAPAGSLNPLAAGSPAKVTTPPSTSSTLLHLVVLAVAIVPSILSLSTSVVFTPTLHTRPATWTREYYGYCWRFRLLDVRGGGNTQFYVTPKEGEAAGRRMPFDVDRILTPLQSAKVACNPVLLHETAHILATHWQRGTGEEVAVSVETSCSLNGRPAQPVVDEDADLTAHPRHVYPLPFTTELPARSSWFI